MGCIVLLLKSLCPALTYILYYSTYQAKTDSDGGGEPNIHVLKGLVYSDSGSSTFSGSSCAAWTSARARRPLLTILNSSHHHYSHPSILVTHTTSSFDISDIFTYHFVPSPLTGLCQQPVADHLRYVSPTTKPHAALVHSWHNKEPHNALAVCLHVAIADSPDVSMGFTLSLRTAPPHIKRPIISLPHRTFSYSIPHGPRVGASSARR